MFDWLTALVNSQLAYALVFLVPGVDAFFPVVPGETVVILAALFAARDQLALEPLIPLAWAGVLIGDHISYFLGRYVGHPISRRLFQGRRAKERLNWAQNLIRTRGPTLVLAARFVPGGRTAATFSAGTLGMKWGRFFLADFTAGLLWASYSVGIGYFSGRVFAENTWLAAVLAAGLAVILGLLSEGIRRWLTRGKTDKETGAEEETGETGGKEGAPPREQSPRAPLR